MQDQPIRSSSAFILELPALLMLISYFLFSLVFKQGISLLRIMSNLFLLEYYF